MNITLAKGRYVLAVSGGVDSVTLLDVLSKKPDVELVVAHFDHGIRADSGKDANFVAKLASQYGLAFELGKGRLGKHASEEVAREARYKFLEKVQIKHRAKAIITGHHQDDWLETAFINLLRGTGPRGLVAIAENSNIVRPLLGFTKKQIISYAKAHKLRWIEDETNIEKDYLRNYLRHNIMPKITQAQRVELVNNIDKVAKKQQQKDLELATLSHLLLQDNRLNRQLYIQLPASVGREILANWLKLSGYRSFDTKKLNRIDMAIRTGRADTKYPVSKGMSLKLKSATAQLTSGLTQ